MKLTKQYLIKLIKEEVNRLDEVTREEVKADLQRMYPEETPEQIEARVNDYMAPLAPEPTKRGDPSAGSDIRAKVQADFERMFPEETPEQIKARVDDYMAPLPPEQTRRGDPTAPIARDLDGRKLPL